MDLLEIAAEKIRAAATRVRYRDFYDLYLILGNPQIEIAQAVNLLRQKEIRASISPNQIQANWQQAQREANDDLRAIHCSRQIEHGVLTEMVLQLKFEPISRK